MTHATTPSSSPAENAYDAVPYESYPYDQTHIQHLYTVGKVFGMTPVDFRKARVLELGCSMGGNIIPMASLYPESTFLGLDLSDVQISRAKQEVAALGLTNISFETRDIMNVSKADGLFDYIIVHGILSWVPEPVQKKILHVCDENLSPNGIAIVSYNTLPGWNIVRTFRDMMKMHTDRFPDGATKASQARALLQFVQEATADSTAPYALALRQEIQLLSSQQDNYLLHDHLEATNAQFYLKDFMEMAGKHNLQYLADAYLSTMYAGNLPEKTAQVLNTADDIVSSEQYMDFIYNRRFRNTLLCHKDVSLNRNVDVSLIKNFYIQSLLVADKPLAEIDPAKDPQVNFTYQGITANCTQPTATALLAVLQENAGRRLHAEDAVRLANARLSGGDHTSALWTALQELGMRLVFNGGFRIFSDPGTFSLASGEKPTVLAFARHQAKNQAWVANALHQRVDVGLLPRIVISYLDGNHTLADVVERVISHIEKGEITITINDTTITTPRDHMAELNQLITGMVTQFGHNALLVA